MEEVGVCCYCDQTFERADLRPYGFGGKLCCHPCMESTPQRKAESDRRSQESLRRTVKEAARSSRIVQVTDRGYEVVRKPSDLPKDLSEYEAFLVPADEEEREN